MRDAVKAHQAVPDEAAPDGVRWLVTGEIEEEEGAEVRFARLGRN